MHRDLCRFRSLHGELLESRHLLNAAPVGVADQYEIEKDTVLVADRPVGVDSFANDFDDGVLGPNLEGTGFTIADGQVHRVGAAHQNDRAYIRTVDANYLDVDFRFEVTVHLSNTRQTAISFVGMGRGEGEPGVASSEPQDSLYLRIHGPNTSSGEVAIANRPANNLRTRGPPIISSEFFGTRFCWMPRA